MPEPCLGLLRQRVLWAAAPRSAPSPRACPGGLPEPLGRRSTTSSATPMKRPRILTCFSTLTTRPIILISSTASVSEGPLSPFSRAFRSPGPLPTIWSTLWGKRTVKGPGHIPPLPPTRTGGSLTKGEIQPAPVREAI